MVFAVRPSRTRANKRFAQVRAAQLRQKTIFVREEEIAGGSYREAHGYATPSETSSFREN
jgi:hypothetical protein